MVLGCFRVNMVCSPSLWVYLIVHSIYSNSLLKWLLVVINFHIIGITNAIFEICSVLDIFDIGLLKFFNILVYFFPDFFHFLSSFNDIF